MSRTIAHEAISQTACSCGARFKRARDLRRHLSDDRRAGKRNKHGGSLH